MPSRHIYTGPTSPSSWESNARAARHCATHSTQPQAGHAHYNLGVLLENKADYGGAEQHYRRARAIDPEEHADAHCELAGQPRPSWCL